MDTTAPQRGWPAGMNNLAAEHEMPENTLRDATNVDVRDSGRLSSRKGFSSPVLSGTNIHSLFAHKSLSLIVEDGALVRVLPDWSKSVIASGLAKQAAMAYQVVNDEVVWSNGSAIGVVAVSGAARALGVDPPASQPALTASANGALAAGRYQVAVTYLSASGEESGTGRCALVEIVAGQAITLTNIPQPVSAGVAKIGIYATEADGAVPYLSAIVAVGTTSFVLRAQATKGRELATQFCAKFPPCERLALLGGRLYGALGSALVFSDPLVYGRFRPGVNILYFPEQITVLRAVDDGLWVVADQTYFLAGREPGQPLRAVLPYRAVPGTEAKVPNSDRVTWFSERGFVIAGPGGAIENISEAAVTLGLFESGAAIVREQDGLRQIVSSMKSGGTTNQLLVTDYAEGEVIRGQRRVGNEVSDQMSFSSVVSEEPPN